MERDATAAAGVTAQGAAARAAERPTWVEREAVRDRPSGPPVGYQEWRRLLFLHWAVPAEMLRPLVPPPLSLDLYDGAAYVGLVPFWVQAARPLGAPRSLGLRFLETNVRTYVHVGGRDPGVYFFSLDAGSLLAAVGARAALGLPYFLARGRERLDDGGIDYALQRVSAGRPEMRVRYEVGEHVGPAAPGTLDFFLIERYLLHAQRGPTIWTVQVHHHPYPLQRARVVRVVDDLMGAAGVVVPDEPPLAHYAAGVDVEVFPPRVSFQHSAINLQQVASADG